MKWFFLLVLFFLLAAASAILIANDSTASWLGLISVFSIAAGLFLIWLSAYFSSAANKPFRLLLGHSLTHFGSGAGLLIIGMVAAASHTCPFSGMETGGNMLGQLASLATSAGFCFEFAALLALLGLFILLPSVKLYYRLLRHGVANP